MKTFIMKSPPPMSKKQLKAITAGAVALLTALAILVVDEELSSLRGFYMHQSMRPEQRGLSIDLGGGDCEWKQPMAFVPPEMDLYKTLLVGFPSGDKRMAYVQMEALTGFPSKDDWDFAWNGYSNAPFIKTNYPHPSSTWSWDREADQVVLVLQYIRRSMVEYSDIMWHLSVESLDSQYNAMSDLGLLANENEKKVTICHHTESETNPWEEIDVSTSAVQAHLKHGDFIGSCEDVVQYLTYKAENTLDQHDKVTMCHRTNSETNPWENIEVSTSAVQAHLDEHGDHIGSCDVVLQYLSPESEQIDDERYKVSICHRTKCEKNPWIDLKISASGAKAHLLVNQGDLVGSCDKLPEFETKQLVYNVDRETLEEQYTHLPDVEAFYIWRDQRLINEIYKYGWYIDYWMENGLLRDPFSHEQVCQEKWEQDNCPKAIENVQDKVTICHRTASETNPEVELEVSSHALEPHLDHGDYIGSCEEYATQDKVVICHRTASDTNPWIDIEVSVNALEAHLAHGDIQGTCEDAAQDPTFMNTPRECVNRDPNCDKLTGSCRPVAIISADKLRVYESGPTEVEIIGNALMNNPTMAEFVINRETWPCIWNKVIGKHEGPTTYDGLYDTQGPNFSSFMLEEMIGEVTRLLDKYSSGPWTTDVNAKRLVSLLSEHIPPLQKELDEVISGARTLTKKDIYGPGERQAILATATY